MTNTRLLEIGIQKRNGFLPKTSWNELVILHCPTKFKDGEGYRGWVKREVKKIGQLEHKEVKNILNSEVEQLKQKSSTEIFKDGSQSSDRFIEMQEADTKDSVYLMKAHGYDTESWELISARSNIWNSYSTQDGKILMYSSKISVKPRKDELTTEGIKELFNEMSSNFLSIIHTPTRYSDNGKMLEVNVTDLHLAKLGSLDANDIYNEEIAKERFFKIINDIIQRTEGIKFEKILFVWQNDFFHVDNLTNSTTAGTRQDVTMKLNEMFKMGTKMLVQAIDLLSTIAPVHSCYIGANHDRLMSYFATEYLDAWFRNNPNVTIDADPKIRKYIEFGKCLIGLTHGHAEGKRVKHVMPVEAPEAWGRTVYREIHQGHIHSEKAYIVEENGIIVRNLSSPSGNDTWHYDSAYVGSIRKSQNFIWDKENGLEAILNISF